MIDAAACPNAHALTSCAKSTTWPSVMTRSTMTVEPHSFEWAVAVAPGAASRPWRGILPARSRIRWLYISKKLASLDIEVQVTAPPAYYIGKQDLANEIWKISKRI